MTRTFEEVLQDVNALFIRAEAKPPYRIDLLDKGAAVLVADSSATPDREINSNVDTAEMRMLRDPNVWIGGIRDSQGRNIIEPWADSHSMFAGFRGNFALLTKAPELLFEILTLFVDQPEPEPVPEPVVEPPVPPVKLRKLPKVAIEE